MRIFTVKTQEGLSFGDISSINDITRFTLRDFISIMEKRKIPDNNQTLIGFFRSITFLGISTDRRYIYVSTNPIVQTEIDNAIGKDKYVRFTDLTGKFNPETTQYLITYYTCTEIVDKTIKETIRDLYQAIFNGYNTDFNFRLEPEKNDPSRIKVWHKTQAKITVNFVIPTTTTTGKSAEISGI